MGLRLIGHGVVAIVLVLTTVPFAAEPAAALAAYIHVNTTSDTVAGDGYCSLREAIVATNVGGGYYDCNAGTTGTDTIYLDVSPINITSELPTFAVPVFIDSYLGGPRAEIHGPGSGTALKLQGGGTSSVRNLKIDNFATAIYSISLGLTLTGNVIGPNTSKGIWLDSNGSSATIGGTNGVSSNQCTGDCNLISGNASAGILATSENLTIKGNWFGVDASGTSAVPNGEAIELNGGGTSTIGGATAAERNIISGSTSRGMFIGTCVCTVQGNYIGTNVAGNAAIPNAIGMIVGAPGQTIGGSSAGAGNVISGNTGDGIYSLDQSVGTLTIEGNRIGTKAGGGALANGGNGINLDNGDSGVQHVLIGTTSPGTGNVIAYNGGAGIRINGSLDKYDSIRGNSIHDNGGAGILLLNSANEAIAAPVLLGIGPIHGTACAGCIVDVYSDSADEGSHFEGAAAADGSGNWSYSPAVSGPNVTAVATNGNNSSSQFSAPFAFVQKKPDGRIRKGSGSYVGNNIYNITGTNQTKSGTTTRGNTMTFGISIQNDAATADKFTVLASGATVAGYTIKYFHGTTDITSAVVAGTYTTTSLGPGGKFGIKARVAIGNGAAIGSSVTRLVTITSFADTAKKDAVKFIAKRR